MKLFEKNLDHEVVCIAEIGVNHEGDPEKAVELLRLAAAAGADAAKFQSYTPARFASASDPERLARVSRFRLDLATHERLAREAEKAGIAFFSTPVTEDMVEPLARLCPALKIASGDLTFAPVIRQAARSGRPMILSTGLGTVEEIDQAVAWCQEEMGEENLKRRLLLMHCVCAYPTPVEEANVRSVPFLAERYGLTAGYSNHVVGHEACLAAVALGAAAIEVHFTDRREGREFRDHHLSLLPDELSELVRMATTVRKSLGRHGKRRAVCEMPLFPAVRKGVVAARDLPAGHRLLKEDMMFARPATEFDSSALPTLIGRRLSQPLKTGELLTRQGLEAG